VGTSSAGLATTNSKWPVVPIDDPHPQRSPLDGRPAVWCRGNDRAIASVYYIRQKFENCTARGALFFEPANCPYQLILSESENCPIFSPRRPGRAVNQKFEMGASTVEFAIRSCRTPTRTPVNMSEASTREDREFARESRGPKPNRGGSGRFPSR